MGFMKKGLMIGLGAAALYSGQALAQDEAKQPAMDGPPGVNSVNINPLGALFGSYSVNYERLFDRQHGLLVEGVFSSTSNDDSEASAGGLLLGYRWHWSKSQDSGFLGANTSYQAGSGEGTVNGEKFEVSVTQLDFTLNVGRRWAWDGGFNVTFRFGVGRAVRTFDTTSNDPDAQRAVQLVEDAYEILPVSLDGELSIGWVF